MLPAVKVFAVAALLGGGAVGTFALAGGFGPGGNGSGNGGTTTQVAKPATTEPVASALGGVTPRAEATRNGGDNAVDNGVQQKASEGDVVPGQQQSGPQPQEVSSDSSKGQEVDATGKANTESVGETRGTSHVEQEVTSSDSQTGPQGTKHSEEVQNGATTRDNPEAIDQERVPVSSSTITQLSGEDGASGNQEATEGRKVDGETNDAIAAGPEGTPGDSLSASTTDAQRTDMNGLNTGDSTGVVRNTGAEGEETRTASGGENASST